MHIFPFEELVPVLGDMGYQFEIPKMSPTILSGLFVFHGSWGDTPVRFVVSTDWQTPGYAISVQVNDSYWPAVAGMFLDRVSHGWRLVHRNCWMAWATGKEFDLQSQSPLVIQWGQT